MFKRIFTLIILLTSSSSYAVEYAFNKTIKEIFAGYIDGKLFFTTNETIQNPNGCTPTANFYAMEPNTSDVKTALSILLSAHATGSYVNLVIDETSCFENRPVVLRLSIHK